MATLEELLEGFAGDGRQVDSGEFGLTPAYVWKGLSQAISDPLRLPQFLLRWFVAHESKPAAIEVHTDKNSISFRLTATDVAELPSLENSPSLDYSGKDLELSRALICAQKLDAQSVTLSFSDSTRSWLGTFSGGPASWTQQAPSPQWPIELKLTFEKRQAYRLFKEWKLRIARSFGYCPANLTWNNQSLDRSFEFTPPVLVWRRLLPRNHDLDLVSFHPPNTDRVEPFVCSKYPHSEIFIGLGSGNSTDIHLLYKGELLPVSVPGFLPGFQVLINTRCLTLDLQGTGIVESETLRTLLDAIQNEAFDMVLQVYRAPNPISTEVLATHFSGLQSVFLTLLSEQRWTEGHILSVWLEEAAQRALPQRSSREAYTYWKTAELLAERANHPLGSKRLRSRAQEAAAGATSSDPNFAIESALIDASLESKANQDKDDRLQHHTRSRLHLLAVRCKKKGQTPEAFRLFYVLTMSVRYLEPEHLDLWFEAAEMARLMRHEEALRNLGQQLKRSQDRGSAQMSDKLKKRAIQLLKKLPKEQPHEA